MPSSELGLERSLYVGNALGAILYGIQLTLCFQSIYFLSRCTSSGAPDPTKRRRNIFYIAYSLVLAVIVAIGLAANFVFGQFIWINHRDVPGGPPVFFEENTNAWYNTFGTSAGAAGIFMGDALLLFRCYTITGSNIWISIVPAVIFLASTSLGVVSIIASSAPNEFLLKGRPAQFGTAWTSLSVAFNIIVTSIISIKLLIAYRRLRAVTSPEYAEIYAGVAAILIESALPYALFGFIFSVLYGLNNVSSLGFAVVWIGFTGISPQLIILRVAMGTAWAQDTISNAPTTGIKFRQQDNMLERTEVGDISGTVIDSAVKFRVGGSSVSSADSK